MSEETPTYGPTPGADRVFSLTVNGHSFVGRRPSRADRAEINRLYVQKLLRAAPPAADPITVQSAQSMIAAYDGGGLLAEAQIEVLFRVRKNGGTVSDLGECVPPHWLRTLKNDAGDAIGVMISFENVPEDEFSEVARQLDVLLEEKKRAVVPRAT